SCSTTTPCGRNRPETISTSRISGTLRITAGFEPSRAATTAFGTRFLAPRTGTDPLRGLPPSMATTLDIDVSTLHTPAGTRLLTHQSDALEKIGNVPIVGDETYTSESLAGSVVGLIAGRVFSNSSMASALRSVRPMSSRPSIRRQRV